MEKFIHEENSQRLKESTEGNSRRLILDLIAEQETEYRRWQISNGSGSTQLDQFSFRARDAISRRNEQTGVESLVNSLCRGES